MSPQSIALVLPLLSALSIAPWIPWTLSLPVRPGDQRLRLGLVALQSAVAPAEPIRCLLSVEVLSEEDFVGGLRTQALNMLQLRVTRPDGVTERFWPRTWYQGRDVGDRIPEEVEPGRAPKAHNRPGTMPLLDLPIYLAAQRVVGDPPGPDWQNPVLFAGPGTFGISFHTYAVQAEPELVYLGLQSETVLIHVGRVPEGESEALRLWVGRDQAFAFLPAGDFAGEPVDRAAGRAPFRRLVADCPQSTYYPYAVLGLIGGTEGGGGEANDETAPLIERALAQRPDFQWADKLVESLVEYLLQHGRSAEADGYLDLLRRSPHLAVVPSFSEVIRRFGWQTDPSLLVRIRYGCPLKLFTEAIADLTRMTGVKLAIAEDLRQGQYASVEQEVQLREFMARFVRNGLNWRRLDDGTYFLSRDGG